MSTQRKFECSRFDPSTGCAYVLIGEEEYVVEEADGHIIAEHGYQDSPSLRQQIRDSLVNA